MSDVRYVYVRNLPVGKVNPYVLPKATTDITVAYRFDDENQQVIYNSARRGKKDQFRRATGRAVATGRLTANPGSHPNATIPYSEVSTSGGPKYSLISQKIMDIFAPHMSKKKGKKPFTHWDLRNVIPALQEVPVPTQDVPAGVDGGAYYHSDFESSDEADE